MKKKRHKIWFWFVVILGFFFLILWMSPQWTPVFFKSVAIKPAKVEPKLLARGIREEVQQAVKPEHSTVLQHFSFDKGKDSLKEWEEKIFKGQTDFKVLQENGMCYLNSRSQNACSGLYVKMTETASPDLWLSWKWRVNEFPKKKHPELLSNRAEDDFAARVYVIFLGANLFKSDVIEYIWDEKFAPGTSVDSPYSQRIKLLVIRNGRSSGEEKGWTQESRNLYEDYQKLFGKTPCNPVGLLALMSDSDNTETNASADFAEIIIKRVFN